MADVDVDFTDLVPGVTPAPLWATALLAALETLRDGVNARPTDEDVAGTYVTLPGGGDATGSVPTKQSDGSIAYAVPVGGIQGVQL